MITPMWKTTQGASVPIVMWDNVSNVPYYELFLCMGDHGLFCMVRWEEL